MMNGFICFYINQEIEEASKIEARKVRKDFIEIIKEKVNYIKNRYPDVGVKYAESDDWLIALDSLEYTLQCVTILLDHHTGYTEYQTIPMEIGIGKGEYDDWAEFSGSKIITEDSIIKFLKSNLINIFKSWYKEEKNTSIKRTFLVCQKEIYEDLDPDLQKTSIEIEYSNQVFFKLNYSNVMEKFSSKKEPEVNEQALNSEKVPKIRNSIKKAIFNRFGDWVKKNFREDFYLTPDVYDSIFICIIPETLSDNLFDFQPKEKNYINRHKTSPYSSISSINPNYPSEITQYYDTYRILSGSVHGRSKVITTPKKLKENNEITNSNLALFPSGELFIQLNYQPLTLLSAYPRFIGVKEDGFVFNPDILFDSSKSYHYLNTNQYSEKYGTPLTKLIFNNLEHFLKVTCFPYHPECKIRMAKFPTENFFIRIILPGMLLGDKEESRILYEEEPFYKHRQYQGDDNFIIFESSFSYSDVLSVIDQFNTYYLGFFS